MRVRRILVPALVLAFLLALYLWPDRGDDPRHHFGSDVEACKVNLQQIYAGLVLYRARSGHPPRGSGVPFFAELVASGVWEWQDTPTKRAALTCPGPGARPVPEGLDYRDLAALSPLDSAYAGRNTSEYPLLTFPARGDEPLLCCDNALGMNHEGVMNVLYTDGSIVTLVLTQEIAAGRLPPDAQTIPVGKDSPIADLRKLVGD